MTSADWKLNNEQISVIQGAIALAESFNMRAKMELGPLAFPVSSSLNSAKNVRGTCVASFPGSPCAQTKNPKEREEPGKIEHMRNVIGRENLIACGQTNEFAHALLTEYTCSVVKALWLTERD